MAALARLSFVPVPARLYDWRRDSIIELHRYAARLAVVEHCLRSRTRRPPIVPMIAW
jgi:hypothetical protein